MSAVPAWATNYEWNDTGKSGTWDTKSENWYSKEDGAETGTVSAFVNGNNATFSTYSPSVAVSVDVAENISAGSVKIANMAVTLTSSSGSFKVSATSGVDVWGNGTLKYGASDMVAGKITAGDNSAGTLDLGSYSADSATILINGKGTLKLSVNTTGATNATAVSFASGAQLVLDFSNVSIESGTTLSILSSSSSAIQYAGNELKASEVEALAAGSVFGNYSNWKREWAVEKTGNGSTLKLKLTESSAVPEPSAFGLLAGAGALAFVAARRRRRTK